jgi:hypothetical protein
MWAILVSMGADVSRKRMWIITLIVIVIVGGSVGYVMARGNFNSVDVVDYGYYISPSSKDSKYVYTYVYFVFTAPLEKGDKVQLISTQRYHYVVEDWIVSESQAGKRNVSFPMYFTGLMSGTFNLEVERNNNIYRGTVRFDTNVTFHASLEKIKVNPVSSDRSYITGIRINLTSSRPVYVSALDILIGNYDAHVRLERFIANSAEVNIKLSYDKVAPW